MKKHILSVMVISMLIAVPVFGVDTPWTPQTMPAAGTPDIWTILGNVLNWFFNFVLIMAALFIINAGYRYMTAGGDETKTKAAMNNLIYALVGAVVAIFAKGLIYLVTNFIMGKGFTF